MSYIKYTKWHVSILQLERGDVTTFSLKAVNLILMVITMRPADHIKPLRRCNEQSRELHTSQPSASISSRTQSPFQMSAVACLENTKHAAKI